MLRSGGTNDNQQNFTQDITMHHPVTTCRASSARSVSTPAAAAMTAGEGLCWAAVPAVPAWVVPEGKPTFSLHQRTARVTQTLYKCATISQRSRNLSLTHHAAIFLTWLYAVFSATLEASNTVTDKIIASYLAAAQDSSDAWTTLDHLRLLARHQPCWSH